MAVRKTFDSELANLNNLVIEMANLIEESFGEAIEAIETMDVNLCKRIMDKDDIIDDMENTIENECIRLIYTQQPVASDLRHITSILKLITDLERIADNCADIAEYVINLKNKNTQVRLPDIKEMTLLVKTMFAQTIDAFIELDKEKAKETCKLDNKIDDYFFQIINELENILDEETAIVDYIFIVKYLEKIGDHCCNICEWVIYRITGSHEAHM